MKKKVLYIINDMISGGAQRSLINLLELMDYQKYDVELLLFKEKGDFLNNIPKNVKLVGTEHKVQYLYTDNPKILINIKIFSLNIIHIFGTIIAKMFSKSGYHKGQIRWKCFYKYAIPKMKKEYDVAVSYLEGESLYYLVDKVNARRKISFIHTDYSKINADSCFDEGYFDKVNTVIGISEKCVQILHDKFPTLSNKIVYLPNLISSKTICHQAKMFYPNEYKDVSGAILLCVGRLTALKGFDMAIEAAELLKNQGIRFKWFFLGDGELKGDLQAQIKKSSLNEYVEILGVRKNPYPYIKNASIIVQTSRYEGKSMVLDEAKILCKPIVSTNYETVKDQINSKEGIIVDMNPHSISQGIIEMMNGKIKYENYLEEHNYGNDEKLVEYYKVLGGIDEDAYS